MGIKELKINVYALAFRDTTVFIGCEKEHVSEIMEALVLYDVQSSQQPQLHKGYGAKISCENCGHIFIEPRYEDFYCSYCGERIKYSEHESSEPQSKPKLPAQSPLKLVGLDGSSGDE